MPLASVEARTKEARAEAPMRSPLLHNTHPSESPRWSTRVRENLAHLIAPSELTPSSSNGAPIHLLKLDRTTKAASAQTVSLLTRKIVGDAPFLPPHETLTFERPADLTTQRASLGLKGGGGSANPIPVTHGFLPLHSSMQLMSPRVPDNVNHQLPVEVTILDANAPPVVLSNNNVGLPWMANDTNSGGPGHRGIGAGEDGGAGDLDGGGDGRSDGGVSGRGISTPVCEICPYPVYTDEARHVKVQGTVTLRVLVGANGKAAQIRVVRGVGYGLDERAIETVRGWKFTAAHDAAGRNVPAWVIIETVFRLF
jgi:protein TonB